MTRKEMEEVIRGGGGIVHQGQTYTTIEALPSEAELVGDDPIQKQLLRESLETQLAALQTEMRRLGGFTTQSAASAQTDAEEKKKDEESKNPQKTAPEHKDLGDEKAPTDGRSSNDKKR
jgi:hypothetical protein